MGTGISSFFDGKSRVDRFIKESSTKKCKSDVRKLEAALLTPEKIPTYAGEQPSMRSQRPLLNRTVKIVFHSKEDMNLMRRCFKLVDYVETCLSNTKYLVRVLKALDSGEITYDSEKDSFHCQQQIKT